MLTYLMAIGMKEYTIGADGFGEQRRIQSKPGLKLWLYQWRMLSIRSCHGGAPLKRTCCKERTWLAVSSCHTFGSARAPSPALLACGCLAQPLMEPTEAQELVPSCLVGDSSISLVDSPPEILSEPGSHPAFLLYHPPSFLRHKTDFIAWRFSSPTPVPHHLYP